MTFGSDIARAETNDRRRHTSQGALQLRYCEHRAVTHKSFRRAIACVVACTLALPQFAAAQSAVITPSHSSPTSAAYAQGFTQKRLDQMLAPIALYPDGLLSQMLMAATYPREVGEAARWTQQHRSLSARALRAALGAQQWDPSVKSLCAFHTVLERMSRDPAWTQELGEAFIANQQAVMDSIQNLRRRAQAAGTLVSDAHQVVNVEDGDITIAPQNPQVVNVPTYDPSMVYGSWSWPDDPPYYPAYWVPPGGSAFAGDYFYWGTGIAVGLGQGGDGGGHR